MRILMLSRDTPQLGPTSSTAGRWRLLRDQGVTLEIIVASTRKGLIWEEEGLRVSASGGHSPIVRFWRMYQLGKRVASQADLITSEDPLELGLVAAGLAHASGKPFELQDHAGCYEGVRTYEPFGRLRQPLANLLVRYARVVRTVSRTSYQRLQSVYRVPCYWLPIAPQDRFQSVTREQVKDVIICVARLVPVKRIELLLTSFAIFRVSHPSARLVIAGDGPCRSSLERDVHRLGIHEAVTLVGNTDPLPYLLSARVFALLSRHEGWGVAAIEAAMVGVPVVMSRTGCADWLVEHGNAVVVPNEGVSTVVSCLEQAWNQSVAPLTDARSQAETAKQQVAAWRTYTASV